MTIKDITKKYGEGTIFALDDDAGLDVEFISSGSPKIDAITGGGFAKGRVHELYGNEGGGKTTITLHLIAEAQRQGYNCLFIDVEHALDPEYAKAIGVQSSLHVSQPDDAEQALEIACDASGSGEYGVVIMDSVAALVSRAELEGDVGDAHVGLNARLIGQTMRKLAGGASKAGTVVVFINQIREKIGVMFGNPETTPGGRALKFYSSIRMRINRVGSPELGPDGFPGTGTMRVKVEKNKVFPPFRQDDLEILYGHGIDTVGEYLDLGVEDGKIDKKGSHYYLIETGEKMGNGRTAAKDWLREHEDVLETLRD